MDDIKYLHNVLTAGLFALFCLVCVLVNKFCLTCIADNEKKCCYCKATTFTGKVTPSNNFIVVEPGQAPYKVPLYRYLAENVGVPCSSCEECCAHQVCDSCDQLRITQYEEFPDIAGTSAGVEVRPIGQQSSSETTSLEPYTEQKATFIIEPAASDESSIISEPRVMVQPIIDKPIRVVSRSSLRLRSSIQRTHIETPTNNIEYYPDTENVSEQGSNNRSSLEEAPESIDNIEPQPWEQNIDEEPQEMYQQPRMSVVRINSRAETLEDKSVDSVYPQPVVSQQAQAQPEDSSEREIYEQEINPEESYIYEELESYDGSKSYDQSPSVKQKPSYEADQVLRSSLKSRDSFKQRADSEIAKPEVRSRPSILRTTSPLASSSQITSLSPARKISSPTTSPRTSLPRSISPVTSILQDNNESETVEESPQTSLLRTSSRRSSSSARTGSLRTASPMTSKLQVTIEPETTEGSQRTYQEEQTVIIEPRESSLKPSPKSSPLRTSPRRSSSPRTSSLRTASLSTSLLQVTNEPETVEESQLIYQEEQTVITEPRKSSRITSPQTRSQRTSPHLSCSPQTSTLRTSPRRSSSPRTSSLRTASLSTSLLQVSNEPETVEESQLFYQEEQNIITEPRKSSQITSPKTSPLRTSPRRSSSPRTTSLRTASLSTSLLQENHEPETVEESQIIYQEEQTIITEPRKSSRITSPKTSPLRISPRLSSSPQTSSLKTPPRSGSSTRPGPLRIASPSTNLLQVSNEPGTVEGSQLIYQEEQTITTEPRKSLRKTSPQTSPLRTSPRRSSSPRTSSLKTASLSTSLLQVSNEPETIAESQIIYQEEQTIITEPRKSSRMTSPKTSPLRASPHRSSSPRTGSLRTASPSTSILQVTNEPELVEESQLIYQEEQTIITEPRKSSRIPSPQTSSPRSSSRRSNSPRTTSLRTASLSTSLLQVSNEPEIVEESQLIYQEEQTIITEPRKSSRITSPKTSPLRTSPRTGSLRTTSPLTSLFQDTNISETVEESQRIDQEPQSIYVGSRTPPQKPSPGTSPSRKMSQVTSPSKITSQVNSQSRRTSPVTSPLQRTSPISSSLQRTSPVSSPLQRTSPVPSPLRRSSPATSPIQRTSPVTSLSQRTSPVSSPSQRTSPVPSPFQKSSPVTSPLQKSSPVTSPLRRRSPVTSLSQRTSPGSSPLQKKSPVTSPSRRKSPVTSSLQSTSPVSSPLQRTSPVSSPLQRISPVSSPLQRTSPVPSPLQRTSPVPSPLQRTSPVPSPLQRTSPVPSPLQRTLPVPSPLQSTSPVTSQLRSRSPVTSLSQRTSPVTSLAQRVTPVTSPSRRTSPVISSPLTTSPRTSSLRTTSPLTGISRVTNGKEIIEQPQHICEDPHYCQKITTIPLQKTPPSTTPMQTTSPLISSPRSTPPQTDSLKTPSPLASTFRITSEPETIEELEYFYQEPQHSFEEPLRIQEPISDQDIAYTQDVIYDQEPFYDSQTIFVEETIYESSGIGEPYPNVDTEPSISSEDEKVEHRVQVKVRMSEVSPEDDVQESRIHETPSGTKIVFIGPTLVQSESEDDGNCNTSCKGVDISPHEYIDKCSPIYEEIDIPTHKYSEHRVQVKVRISEVSPEDDVQENRIHETPSGTKIVFIGPTLVQSESEDDGNCNTSCKGVDMSPHKYSDKCSPICEEIDIPSHKYSDDCVPTCKGIDMSLHKYSDECIPTCEGVDISPHEYSDDCSPICKGTDKSSRKYIDDCSPDCKGTDMSPHKQSNDCTPTCGTHRLPHEPNYNCDSTCPGLDRYQERDLTGIERRAYKTRDQDSDNCQVRCSGLDRSPRSSRRREDDYYPSIYDRRPSIDQPHSSHKRRSISPNYTPNGRNCHSPSRSRDPAITHRDQGESSYYSKPENYKQRRPSDQKRSTESEPRFVPHLSTETGSFSGELDDTILIYDKDTEQYKVLEINKVPYDKRHSERTSDRKEFKSCKTNKECLKKERCSLPRTGKNYEGELMTQKKSKRSSSDNTKYPYKKRKDEDLHLDEIGYIHEKPKKKRYGDDDTPGPDHIKENGTAVRTEDATRDYNYEDEALDTQLRPSKSNKSYPSKTSISELEPSQESKPSTKYYEPGRRDSEITRLYEKYGEPDDATTDAIKENITGEVDSITSIKSIPTDEFIPKDSKSLDDTKSTVEIRAHSGKTSESDKTMSSEKSSLQKSKEIKLIKKSKPKSIIIKDEHSQIEQRPSHDSKIKVDFALPPQAHPDDVIEKFSPDGEEKKPLPSKRGDSTTLSYCNIDSCKSLFPEEDKDDTTEKKQYPLGDEKGPLLLKRGDSANIISDDDTISSIKSISTDELISRDSESVDSRKYTAEIRVDSKKASERTIPSEESDSYKPKKMKLIEKEKSKSKIIKGTKKYSLKEQRLSRSSKLKVDFTLPPSTDQDDVIKTKPFPDNDKKEPSLSKQEDINKSYQSESDDIQLSDELESSKEFKLSYELEKRDSDITRLYKKYGEPDDVSADAIKENISDEVDTISSIKTTSGDECISKDSDEIKVHPKKTSVSEESISSEEGALHKPKKIKICKCSKTKKKQEKQFKLTGIPVLPGPCECKKKNKELKEGELDDSCHKHAKKKEPELDVDLTWSPVVNLDDVTETKLYADDDKKVPLKSSRTGSVTRPYYTPISPYISDSDLSKEDISSLVKEKIPCDTCKERYDDNLRKDENFTDDKRRSEEYKVPIQSNDLSDASRKQSCHIKCPGGAKAPSVQSDKYNLSDKTGPSDKYGPSDESPNLSDNNSKSKYNDQIRSVDSDILRLYEKYGEPGDVTRAFDKAIPKEPGSDKSPDISDYDSKSKHSDQLSSVDSEILRLYKKYGEPRDDTKAFDEVTPKGPESDKSSKLLNYGSKRKRKDDQQHSKDYKELIPLNQSDPKEIKSDNSSDLSDYDSKSKPSDPVSSVDSEILRLYKKYGEPGDDTKAFAISKEPKIDKPSDLLDYDSKRKQEEDQQRSKDYKELIPLGQSDPMESKSDKSSDLSFYDSKSKHSDQISSVDSEILRLYEKYGEKGDDTEAFNKAIPKEPESGKSSKLLDYDAKRKQMEDQQHSKDYKEYIPFDQSDQKEPKSDKSSVISDYDSKSKPSDQISSVDSEILRLYKKYGEPGDDTKAFDEAIPKEPESEKCSDSYDYDFKRKQEDDQQRSKDYEEFIPVDKSISKEMESKSTTEIVEFSERMPESKEIMPSEKSALSKSEKKKICNCKKSQEEQFRSAVNQVKPCPCGYKKNKKKPAEGKGDDSCCTKKVKDKLIPEEFKETISSEDEHFLDLKSIEEFNQFSNDYGLGRRDSDITRLYKKYSNYDDNTNAQIESIPTDESFPIDDVTDSHSKKKKTKIPKYTAVCDEENAPSEEYSDHDDDTNAYVKSIPTDESISNDNVPNYGFRRKKSCSPKCTTARDKQPRFLRGTDKQENQNDESTTLKKFSEPDDDTTEDVISEVDSFAFIKSIPTDTFPSDVEIKFDSKRRKCSSKCTTKRSSQDIDKYSPSEKSSRSDKTYEPSVSKDHNPRIHGSSLVESDENISGKCKSSNYYSEESIPTEQLSDFGLKRYSREITGQRRKVGTASGKIKSTGKRPRKHSDISSDESDYDRKKKQPRKDEESDIPLCCRKRSRYDRDDKDDDESHMPDEQPAKRWKKDHLSSDDRRRPSDSRSSLPDYLNYVKLFDEEVENLRKRLDERLESSTNKRRVSDKSPAGTYQETPMSSNFPRICIEKKCNFRNRKINNDETLDKNKTDKEIFFKNHEEINDRKRKKFCSATSSDKSIEYPSTSRRKFSYEDDKALISFEPILNSKDTESIGTSLSESILVDEVVEYEELVQSEPISYEKNTISCGEVLDNNQIFECIENKRTDEESILDKEYLIPPEAALDDDSIPEIPSTAKKVTICKCVVKKRQDEEQLELSGIPVPPSPCCCKKTNKRSHGDDSQKNNEDKDITAEDKDKELKPESALDILGLADESLLSLKTRKALDIEIDVEENTKGLIDKEISILSTSIIKKVSSKNGENEYKDIIISDSISIVEDTLLPESFSDGEDNKYKEIVQSKSILNEENLIQSEVVIKDASTADMPERPSAPSNVRTCSCTIKTKKYDDQFNEYEGTIQPESIPDEEDSIPSETMLDDDDRVDVPETPSTSKKVKICQCKHKKRQDEGIPEPASPCTCIKKNKKISIKKDKEDKDKIDMEKAVEVEPESIFGILDLANEPAVSSSEKLSEYEIDVEENTKQFVDIEIPFTPTSIEKKASLKDEENEYKDINLSGSDSIGKDIESKKPFPSESTCNDEDNKNKKMIQSKSIQDEKDSILPKVILDNESIIDTLEIPSKDKKCKICKCSRKLRQDEEQLRLTGIPVPPGLCTCRPKKKRSDKGDPEYDEENEKIVEEPEPESVPGTSKLATELPEYSERMSHKCSATFRKKSAECDKDEEYREPYPFKSISDDEYYEYTETIQSEVIQNGEDSIPIVLDDSIVDTLEAPSIAKKCKICKCKRKVKQDEEQFKLTGIPVPPGPCTCRIKNKRLDKDHPDFDPDYDPCHKKKIVEEPEPESVPGTSKLATELPEYSERMSHKCSATFRKKSAECDKDEEYREPYPFKSISDDEYYEYTETIQSEVIQNGEDSIPIVLDDSIVDTLEAPSIAKKCKICKCKRKLKQDEEQFKLTGIPVPPGPCTCRIKNKRLDKDHPDFDPDYDPCHKKKIVEEPEPESVPGTSKLATELPEYSERMSHKCSATFRKKSAECDKDEEYREPYPSKSISDDEYYEYTETIQSEVIPNGEDSIPIVLDDSIVDTLEAPSIAKKCKICKCKRKLKQDEEQFKLTGIPVPPGPCTCRIKNKRLDKDHPDFDPDYDPCHKKKKHIKFKKERENVEEGEKKDEEPEPESVSGILKLATEPSIYSEIMSHKCSETSRRKSTEYRIDTEESKETYPSKSIFDDVDIEFRGTLQSEVTLDEENSIPSIVDAPETPSTTKKCKICKCKRKLRQDEEQFRLTGIPVPPGPCTCRIKNKRLDKDDPDYDPDYDPCSKKKKHGSFKKDKEGKDKKDDKKANEPALDSVSGTSRRKFADYDIDVEKSEEAFPSKLILDNENNVNKEKIKSKAIIDEEDLIQPKVVLGDDSSVDIIEAPSTAKKCKICKCKRKLKQDEEQFRLTGIPVPPGPCTCKTNNKRLNKDDPDFDPDYDPCFKKKKHDSFKKDKEDKDKKDSKKDKESEQNIVSGSANEPPVSSLKGNIGYSVTSGIIFTEYDTRIRAETPNSSLSKLYRVSSIITATSSCKTDLESVSDMNMPCNSVVRIRIKVDDEPISKLSARDTRINRDIPNTRRSNNDLLCVHSLCDLYIKEYIDMLRRDYVNLYRENKMLSSPSGRYKSFRPTSAPANWTESSQKIINKYHISAEEASSWRPSTGNEKLCKRFRPIGSDPRIFDPLAKYYLTSEEADNFRAYIWKENYPTLRSFTNIYDEQISDKSVETDNTNIESSERAQYSENISNRENGPKYYIIPQEEANDWQHIPGIEKYIETVPQSNAGTNVLNRPYTVGVTNYGKFYPYRDPPIKRPCVQHKSHPVGKSTVSCPADRPYGYRPRKLYCYPVPPEYNMVVGAYHQSVPANPSPKSILGNDREPNNQPSDMPSTSAGSSKSWNCRFDQKKNRDVRSEFQ